MPASPAALLAGLLQSRSPRARPQIRRPLRPEHGSRSIRQTGRLPRPTRSTHRNPHRIRDHTRDQKTTQRHRHASPALPTSPSPRSRRQLTGHDSPLPTPQREHSGREVDSRSELVDRIQERSDRHRRPPILAHTASEMPCRNPALRFGQALNAPIGMAVWIDETRCDNLSRGVDNPLARFRRHGRRELGDRAKRRIECRSRA